MVVRSWLLPPLVGFCLVFVAISCGPTGPKLYPVKGKVLFQDQPTEGATVIFQPINDKSAEAMKPSGVVTADGSFSLSTHPHGEGAPPGEYIVLITWFGDNARGQDNPKNKLPMKYSDLNAKQVLKATVKDGPTELEPFRLTK